MKFTSWKSPVVSLLIITILLSSLSFYPATDSKEAAPTKDIPYYGVTFGGNVSDAKYLIDKVKDYTNLFVIADWDLVLNETKLNEVCQYAYDANLYFMVYFNFVFFNSSQLTGSRRDLFTEAGVEPFHMQWLSTANDRWGDKFLGAYVLDEPGGKQIDVGHYGGFNTTFNGRNQTTFANVTTYSQAARNFTRGLGSYYVQRLNNASIRGSIPNATGRSIPVLTADYALYWFDYLAGYDVVFAELGWKHSEAQHIDLCRGAANVQGKDWGAIVTWATYDPPYMPSAEQMTEELNTAYNAGANYLIVFNYPRINENGVLTEEHLAAIKAFWEKMHSSPRQNVQKPRAALVLPKDYGWGMRDPGDRIWGLWPADDLSPVIAEKAGALLTQYGTRLDIIYDDPSFNYTEKYSTLYYWNGTTIQKELPFFNLSTPTALYTSVIVLVAAVTCVPSYIVLKKRKNHAPKVVAQVKLPSKSNATLKGVGKGRLELVDDKILFHTAKGRLKKQPLSVKEIPLNEVEAAGLDGNRLTISWKGTTETLVVRDHTLAEAINAQVAARLQQLKEKMAVTELHKKEASRTLKSALNVVDVLFDVLRSLQAKPDWIIIGNYVKRMEENTKRLANSNVESANFDVSKLTSASEKHLSKETSKETYSLLKGLYDYFTLLAVKEAPDEVHLKDAKATLTAYYTLNDIILSVEVGEKGFEKEYQEFEALVAKLPTSDAQSSMDELKLAIEDLTVTTQKDDAVKEIRFLCRRLLKINGVL